MVTGKVVEEFKSRMHISHSSEDSDLQRLLSLSVAFVEDKCGKFDIEGEKNIDKRATELVMERSRYAYNDALEYFEENFKSEIFSLGIEMAGDADEEV